jgi:uncharacterized protein YdaU (DUF1376 family)
MKPPAFQFYPKDYLTDEHVRAMSFAQRGLYWEAISICWLEGSLPKSLPQLGAVLGCPLPQMRALWPRIAPCFSAAGGRLVHKRLERERIAQAQSRERRAAAARKRWGKTDALHEPSSAGDQAAAAAEQCSPSASASATPIRKKRAPALTRYAQLGMRNAP